MATNVTRGFLLIIQDKIGMKNNTITRLISISSMIFLIQFSIQALIKENDKVIKVDPYIYIYIRHECEIMPFTFL